MNKKLYITNWRSEINASSNVSPEKKIKGSLKNKRIVNITSVHPTYTIFVDIDKYRNFTDQQIEEMHLEKVKFSRKQTEKIDIR